MLEVIGYEGNKAIYKDMGAARVHGASGITAAAKQRQVMRTVNIIQHLERVEHPKSYLKKVLSNER